MVRGKSKRKTKSKGDRAKENTKGKLERGKGKLERGRERVKKG